MGRIVGIDYGLKRVGIAVSDPLQIIANGLITVSNNKVVDFLLDYSKKEQIDEFVIGYPLNLNDTPTHATKPVEDFIKILEKKFPDIPIHKEDERYTSKMAVKSLVESGTKKSKRRDKSLIDKVSATLILQSYMQNK